MTRESAKASYLRNREKRLAQMQARYQKEREIVLAKLGGKCACCGEIEPLFLTIDHINDDGYEQRNSRRADYTRMSAWLIRNNFPPGFQILCMNCNQGKHRNKGICPHQKGSTTRSIDRSVKWREAPGTDIFGHDIAYPEGKPSAVSKETKQD